MQQSKSVNFSTLLHTTSASERARNLAGVSDERTQDWAIRSSCIAVNGNERK
jgi:hypothetical protein